MTPALHFALSLGMQGILLLYDDVVLHRRRGLPRWERAGHPIDAFFFSLPIAIAAFGGPTTPSGVYWTLSFLSCIIILKDEWVHVGRIGALEATIHAALFVIHPVTLVAAWRLAQTGETLGLVLAWIALLGVVSFQTIYWNFGEGPHERH